MGKRSANPRVPSRCAYMVENNVLKGILVDDSSLYTFVAKGLQQ